MDPADIDSGSLPAVKSLRSKFEQLAVDTARITSRPSSSTGDLLNVDTSSPKVRRPSGSHLDFSTSQTHLRTSSSSSDLKVGTKRPPPPPPPRAAKPQPSPNPSRSPSPLPPTLYEERKIPQGATTLKSLPNNISSTISVTIESPRPTLPPRPNKYEDAHYLSASPINVDPLSSASLSPTPSYHRPPPPPPRSRSPRPQSDSDSSNAASSNPRLSPSLPLSNSISRQNVSMKPAVPPRPTKTSDTMQPAVLPNQASAGSPDSILSDAENEPPIPLLFRSGTSPTVPFRQTLEAIRGGSYCGGHNGHTSYEADQSQAVPPLKYPRSTMPPPPPRRHQSTLLSVPAYTEAHSLKTSSQPPPLPTRRGMTNPLEETNTTTRQIPDQTLSFSSERKTIAKLPPPPTRTIGLGDKLPPPRRPPSPESEEGSDEEDDPKAQAVDQMPDSSATSRRPPILSFRDDMLEPRIHAHPHSGAFVASGTYIVVGHHYNIKIYDLALSDVPIFALDTREMGSKDSKVTAMEIRYSSAEADRGALLWIGTKDGHLFEIDVRTGQLAAVKHAAHPYPITYIFRHGRSMISMDEAGKTLVFSPGENEEDVSLSHATPRVIRTTEKQEFVKLLDGKLWTATRTEQHAHTPQRLPIIRIYDILNPGVAGKSIFPIEHCGPVTSATIIPTQRDYVYVGHEEGFVSIWALRTDDGYPRCTEVLRVSTSDVLCLEGVNDRLWAGSRNGMISAFDVSQKPWVVTNCWIAHPGLPVLRMSVNHNAIEKNGKLCVVSMGRDEQLRLWDGLLRLDWIDTELSKSEQSFSSFRNLSLQLVSWNCDSARPDALTSDLANLDFLHDALNGPASPDIIAFGFQEVIDLENRKMAAKNVLLGKKRPEDNGLGDKVTGAYKRWHERLTATVRAAMPPDCPYTVVHTENLVGLFTCVFVKNAERVRLSDVAVKTVKRGMGGRYGNKGAIVARFVIGDSSVCIINCHLAAGQNAVRRRNADAASMLEEKAVFPLGDQSMAYVDGGDGSMVLDHEIVFFHGDLNYRIDQRRDAIIAAVRAGDLQALWPHDQLLREIKYNRGFRLRGFQEGLLTFAPTYKYDIRSDEYDTSEKRRAPAWCDRILWRSRFPNRVRLLEYRRYEANVSDHRPISGSFEITMKVIDRSEREKRKLEVEKLWVEVEGELLQRARDFYVDQMLL